MQKKHRVMMDNVLIQMETGEITKNITRNDGTTIQMIVAAENTRETMAREEAVIEQLGSQAFIDYPEHERPKVGDRVVIARYAGKTLGKYADDKERRVIQDSGILAVIEEVN